MGSTRDFHGIGGIRTHDLVRYDQTLYQLSYPVSYRIILGNSLVRYIFSFCECVGVEWDGVGHWSKWGGGGVLNKYTYMYANNLSSHVPVTGLHILPCAKMTPLYTV